MNVLLAITWVGLNLAVLVDADCYMGCPRGSNNRLNEKSANRRNANRCFDSQNNNRGGYNVGDKTDKAATKFDEQNPLEYFMSGPEAGASTFLPIEWTNQHGCGAHADGTEKLNCNIVIQYMCQKYVKKQALDVTDMRDGTNTNTNDYQKPKAGETYAAFKTRRQTNSKIDRVLQDPFEWYDKCTTRKRNSGLFTADQQLKGDTSIYTRQNPQGTRRGYECPEERDYYPYWHPTPWKDAFILAGNGDGKACQAFTGKSFNTNPKFECVEKWAGTNTNVPMKHYSQHNNETACKAGGGEWLEFQNYLEINEAVKTKGACEASPNQVWARPMFFKDEKCLVKLKAPECKKAAFSRVNHLGNGNFTLEPLHVMWKIPHFPSEAEQTCVLRIRYNISTDDYDPDNTFATPVDKSPIKQNPTVPPFSLKLAINTAQFGRTFQDRSHIFRLIPRSSRIKDTSFLTRRIHIVTVRGKRGNIVQTFPAVEYDYIPTTLTIKQNDLVHYTWTGSNTHNNGNPAGDGQAGDDGQGRRGTDRSNVCGLGHRNTNFLLPHDNAENLCSNIKTIVWSHYGGWNSSKSTAGNSGDLIKADACIQLMSSGYYGCLKAADCHGESLEKKNEMNSLLDNAHPSFHGILLEFEIGKYHYVCSRNNNYTNRSQKGTLIVNA